MRGPVLPVCLLGFLCLAAAAPRAQNQPPPRDESKSVDLPDGEGLNILQRACTVCHDLDEVTKFRDHFTKDDWRDIVGTMVKYGAELKEGEEAILVDYLGKNLSKK